MNFNKTTEYAFRILSYMASDETRLFRAGEIFKNLKIPFRYLRKMLTTLTKSGLLISIQGKGGGYKISKSPKEISLLDIVEATGDQVIKNECFFGFEKCSFENNCAMHEKWVTIKKNICEVIKNTSLADLNKEESHNYILTNSQLLTKNS